MNLETADELGRRLADQSFDVTEFDIVPERGAVRLAYVPENQVVLTVGVEVATVVRFYLDAERDGLDSERLDVRVMCPDCKDEGIMGYSMSADQVDDYLDGPLSQDDLVKRVTDSITRWPKTCNSTE